jgi:serine/threonine-protein kinase
MSDDALDISVARYVRQTGMASPEQLSAALARQALRLGYGMPISLAEALFQTGALTEAQRRVVEEKAQAQNATIQQLGPFKLLRKIGEGGMGAVYLAESTSSGQKAAIKVLPRAHASNPEFLRRFKREAAAMSKLDHPNIVRAFETGEDAGYHFFVMEYCDGETLDKILKRGPLPTPRALQVTLMAARGLHHAHEQGVIHRDVKPSNIILTESGAAKLLDLGLSKVADESHLSFHTLSGAVIGTPHYISPEQGRGEKEIDARTDIYSLGATLYHLLAGSPPFQGSSALEIITKHVTAEFPNPQDLVEDIPDEAVHVLRKMMAKARDDRYRDCGELLADLERVQRGEKPTSQVLEPGKSAVALMRQAATAAKKRRTLAIKYARPPAKRFGALVFAGAGLIVAAVVIAAALSSKGPEPSSIPGPSATAPGPTPKVPLPTAAIPKPPEPREGREEAAKSELNEILKFAGLAPADLEGRAARLEQFISKHPGTFAAADATSRLTELRKRLARSPVPPPEDAFVQEVSNLPAEEQVRRVVAELKQLNAGYDGSESHQLYGTLVGRLSLPGPMIRDISPVRALRDLEALQCQGDWDRATGRMSRSPLADLSPLRGMKLRELYVSVTSVSDLAPLRDLPNLEVLHVTSTPVTDLAPLSGSKLVDFACVTCKVSDLFPLRGAPLEILDVRLSGVTDLSAIEGAPIRILRCDPSLLPGAAFLRSVKSLEKINDRPAAEVLEKPPAPARVEAGSKDAQGWTILFNGHDLTGWQSVDGSPRVQDGEIVLEGGSEILFPVASPDFELGGEVMLVKSTDVVGAIAIRRPVKERAAAARVVFDADGDVSLTESVSLDPRIAKSPSSRLVLGRWHRFLLRAAGSSMSLEVDGSLAVSGQVSSRAPGYLCLYGSAEEKQSLLRFRGLKLRPLAAPRGEVGARDPQGWVSLFNGRDLSGWSAQRSPSIEDQSVRLDGNDVIYQTLSSPDFEIRARFRVNEGSLWIGFGPLDLVRGGDRFALIQDGDIHVWPGGERRVVAGAGKFQRKQWHALGMRVLAGRLTLEIDGSSVASADLAKPPVGIGFFPYKEYTADGDAAVKDVWWRELAADGRPRHAQGPRLAMPPAEALRQAEARLRESHKEEYAKRTAEAQQALARKLLAAAPSSADDAAQHCAALTQARDLAVSAADLVTAFAADDAFAGTFEVDPFKGRSETLKDLAAKPLRPEGWKALGERAQSLSAEALAADRYPDARSLALRAVSAAARIKDDDLSTRGQFRADEAEALQREFARVPEAIRVLERKPDDPPACLIAGVFYGIVKGDWERGLPYLARGSDAKLAALAQQDLALPADGAARKSLADGWWDRSASERIALRKACLLERAGTWYREALPGLSGADRAVAETRLLAVDAGRRPRAPVELLRLVDLSRDVTAGGWKASGSAFTNNGGALSVIEFPYEPPESYDLSVTVERKSGANGAFGVGVVVGGQQITVVIDETGRGSFIEYIDDKKEPLFPRPTLADNRPSVILCRVRRASIAVLVDGKQILAWEGDPKRLSKCRS